MRDSLTVRFSLKEEIYSRQSISKRSENVFSILGGFGMRNLNQAFEYFPPEQYNIISVSFPSCFFIKQKKIGQVFLVLGLLAVRKTEEWRAWEDWVRQASLSTFANGTLIITVARTVASLRWKMCLGIPGGGDFDQPYFKSNLFYFNLTVQQLLYNKIYWKKCNLG